MTRSGLRRMAAGLVIGWSLAAGAAVAAPMSVYTSIVPVRTFVEAVGGERVETTALVKPGQSPASFDPGPRELSRLEGAALFFRVGVPFEQTWMTRLRAAAPQMSVVDLREGIQLRSIKGDVREPDATDDGDGGDDAADTEGVPRDAAQVAEAMPKGRVPAELADPHIWTSPRNAVMMVEHIRDALARQDPEHRELYERNAAAYIERLRSLDQTLTEQLKPFQGRSFMVFHPSWGYFADAYDLKQVPIEAGGSEPGAAALDELIAEARDQGLRVVFVQSQFSDRSAQAVAEAINGKTVSIDPLASDYIDNLRRVADALAEGFE